MVNRYRGEVGLGVEGHTLVMRLTLGALAELERAFSVDSLAALAARFTEGRLSASDVVRILAAGLRGAGAQLTDDEVARLAIDRGPAGAIEAAIDLLDATFNASAGTGEGARPPRPPAV